MIHFGQLGDVVLGLPALAAVRSRFPHAHITAVVGKVPDQVVRLSKVADEVMVVDRVELRDGPTIGSIVKIFRFVAELRRRAFDLVIDLHSLKETNLLAFLTGARSRLLADRENRSINILGNFRPRPPREDKSKHLTHRYLDVLKPLAIPGVQSVFRFAPDAAHVDHVRREVLKDEAVEYIGLFPGAGHPSRCWPLASFLALAERISVSGGSPVFFLGPEESTLKASIEERLPPRSLIVHDLTIPQFIAATQRLAAFVTNDTGPMHLAACAGAPVLLLLDERAPMTYLPLTERLTIVRDATIDRISVDRVYGALRGELLSK